MTAPPVEAFPRLIASISAAVSPAGTLRVMGAASNTRSSSDSRWRRGPRRAEPARAEGRPETQRRKLRSQSERFMAGHPGGKDESEEADSAQARGGGWGAGRKSCPAPGDPCAV